GRDDRERGGWQRLGAARRSHGRPAGPVRRPAPQPRALPAGGPHRRHRRPAPLGLRLRGHHRCRWHGRGRGAAQRRGADGGAPGGHGRPPGARGDRPPLRERGRGDRRRGSHRRRDARVRPRRPHGVPRGGGRPPQPGPGVVGGHPAVDRPARRGDHRRRPADAARRPVPALRHTRRRARPARRAPPGRDGVPPAGSGDGGHAEPGRDDPRAGRARLAPGDDGRPRRGGLVRGDPAPDHRVPRDRPAAARRGDGRRVPRRHEVERHPRRGPPGDQHPQLRRRGPAARRLGHRADRPRRGRGRPLPAAARDHPFLRRAGDAQRRRGRRAGAGRAPRVVRPEARLGHARPGDGERGLRPVRPPGRGRRLPGHDPDRLLVLGRCQRRPAGGRTGRHAAGEGRVAPQQPPPRLHGGSRADGADRGRGARGGGAGVPRPL
ncbi:MAG: Peptidase M20D, amidohydrolase, partial [uncultured Acidimicrobiales bacterium]